MQTRLQYKSSHKGKYRIPYVYIPKEIFRKAKWLKKQKVVEIEVDMLGHITIKP